MKRSTCFTIDDVQQKKKWGDLVLSSNYEDYRDVYEAVLMRWHRATRNEVKYLSHYFRCATKEKNGDLVPSSNYDNCRDVYKAVLMRWIERPEMKRGTCLIILDVQQKERKGI